MSQAFSYRHLYYFWVVGKEGGIARAAERLGMAVQTVSAQVHALEAALGHALLRPAGRGLVLTDAGRAVLGQADQIFQLGAALPDVLRDVVETPSVRLVVGISDGLPKLAVRRLLEPVIAEPHLRLRCEEGEFGDLLGDLALHRLDVVFADRAAAAGSGLKIYSHSLGSSPIAWYASPSQAAAARKDFPRSLAGIPVLLPTAHSALRARIDQWFERREIAPQVVGEFEDSALLATFGASGMGVFPAVESVEQELIRRYGVRRVGACDGISEHMHAMVAERRVLHPLVLRILQKRV